MAEDVRLTAWVRGYVGRDSAGGPAPERWNSG